MSELNPRGPVVHLLAGFDPFEGQARVVARLAAGIEDEHVLLCGRADGVPPQFTEVVETGSDPSGFGLLDGDRVRGVLRRLRPGVVHFHGGPLGALAMARHLRGFPSVATIYGWPRVGRDGVGRGCTPRQLVRTPVLAPRTLAASFVPPTMVGAMLQRAGVGVVLTPDPRVRAALSGTALRVGVYSGTTPPGPVRAHRPGGPHLVFAGRAERTRGADLLAASVTALRRRGSDVRASFYLLEGAHTSEVLRDVRREGCAVHQGGAELDRAIADATAVVLPFRHDATTAVPAQVATEAMAVGVPVIGGDVHCLRAVVADEQTGLLVAPASVSSLTRAICRLLDDPGLVERLGTRAWEETRRRWTTAGVLRFAEWAYGQVAPMPPHEVRPVPVGARSATTRMEEV